MSFWKKGWIYTRGRDGFCSNLCFEITKARSGRFSMGLFSETATEHVDAYYSGEPSTQTDNFPKMGCTG